MNQQIKLKAIAAMQHLSEAKRLLEDIPPDLVDNNISDILGEMQSLTQREEIKMSFAEANDPTEISERDLDNALKAFKADQNFGNFTKALEAGSDMHVRYWVQTDSVIDLLNELHQDLVKSHNLYLTYDVEDELLTLNSKEGIILRLQGEDVYDEIKGSLKTAGWFSQPADNLANARIGSSCGWVNIRESLEEIPVKEHTELVPFLQMPAHLKIAKLFEAYYDLPTKGKFGYRCVPSSGSIFLTYLEKDIVGYNASNVSWPGLDRRKDSNGQYYFVEKGCWSSMDQHQRKLLKEHFLREREPGSRSCYFSPLRWTEDDTVSDSMVRYRGRRRRKRQR